ncbi:type I glyceraldehyde-3-phosphate dehydrogenase [Desulfobaculum bizertense]|uniref:Glyceraldehyde-3-phosphate dehydrogenase n=1 Tax=Desulfobaculum bizertense DSM 18034 TaxID=1121442 RepID=A0A1T4VGG9_9BACT|nr:type I glyceraldehyde-3-phosphate dehydrogenase [Desulfobaculum bizertense]UIJ37718.1 type I glyceraldehyde-3-phosphate dehydrogenase [Desulfobaculum bizertense]SKA63621.1 glyceraldehyde-3-phosphate dehydrogenase (NAD+) [Desulfobaculum bizertense DSM 18034]
MAVKIGINGFGRIGRFLTRLLATESDVELSMVNARADNAALAHLLKYDSVHGRFDGEVVANDEGFLLNGKQVKVSRNPIGDWTWNDGPVDIVVETTGRVKDREGLARHIECGAKKVIIGAPGKGVDLTVVPGVNDDLYDPAKHDVLSNASCTTNCLAPATKVINDTFGIKHGLMTTIHSYTMSQRILDGSHKDLRRARAAAMNIIPTTTGAAKAVTAVIPELKGRLDGMAMRVPTPNVSLVDVVFELERDVTAEEVNDVLKAASEGAMKGNMGYTDEPLVSIDFVSSSFGGVVDSMLTNVMDKRMLKLIIWYDNEGGYTNQLLRLIKKVAKSM